jgi:hypothetical protein
MGWGGVAIYCRKQDVVAGTAGQQGPAHSSAAGMMATACDVQWQRSSTAAAAAAAQAAAMLQGWWAAQAGRGYSLMMCEALCPACVGAA